MAKSNSDPLKTANSSGFPLQIRIKNVAELHGSWNVLAEEFPWCLDINDQVRFGDLIIIDEYKTKSLVIECKRVKDTEWVFLIPETNPNERSFFRSWINIHRNTKTEKCGWYDFQAAPKSYNAKFCAIVGNNRGRRTIIEKIASELIDSVEAVSRKEIDLACKSNIDFQRVYIPVIVTTAQLKVGFFDPKDISLIDGDLQTGTKFENIPYIRFRKTLSSKINAKSKEKTIDRIYKEAERTIYVVNAESFNDFISNFEITSTGIDVY